MPDDRKNVGEPDRCRVSVSEDFEVEYFARQHHLSVDEVRELISGLATIAKSWRRPHRHCGAAGSSIPAACLRPERLSRHR
jgi:hypothetical protein